MIKTKFLKAVLTLFSFVFEALYWQPKS